MKRQTKLFKHRAVNSLTLAIELFNRPHERARTEGVLIFLQHSFEMLLKAAIYEQRGRIRDPRSKMNYRFDKCLHIAQNDLKLVKEEAAVSLRILDGYRDCAMHHHLDLSEHGLYLNAQAAVTVFNELLMAAFGESLGSYLPERVLPVSTSPPTEMRLFMEREFDHLRQLLRPGRRKGAQASAAIRPFLIMESALQGQTEQPPESRVQSTARRIKAGESWRTLLPGVASLRLDTTGQGLTYSVKFVRASSTTEALPVHVIREHVGHKGALAVREVDMLTRYSMNLSELAQNLV